MKIGNLVEKVNSLYQTSKDIIRNPKRLAVLIALGLALSYAPRTYSGTIYDPILDGILNSGGAFTEVYDIPPEDEVPGMIRFRTNTPPR